MNNNTEIDPIQEPYRIVQENMISVCCCCFPQDSICKVFPDLRGQQLSHGICKRHADRWKADLALQRMARELRAHNTAYFNMA